MCCSIHKLNGIGIQTLEKSNLRVCSFRHRKRSREAHNRLMGNKRDTTGRESGRAAFLTEPQKAKLCEKKLLVVGFPLTYCGSAIIPTKSGGVE